MRVLVVDGFTEETETSQMLRAILERHDGDETNTIVCRDEEVAYCTGCFGCWTRTPGICIIDDRAREIVRDFIESDLVVFLTPITFGGYSSELKKVLDRIIPLILPFFAVVNGETHHQMRYDKYPDFVAIGTLEAEDEEKAQAFLDLCKRNSINFNSESYAAVVVQESWSEEQMADALAKVLGNVGVAK